MPPTKKKATSSYSGPWSSSRILNSSSPLASKDILPFLLACLSGWDSNYDETQKRAIIHVLPEKYRNHKYDDSGHLLCPVPLDFLLADPYLRSAVSKFKANLSDGFYEKSWQNQAAKAMQERKDGRFDSYLREKVETEFGVGGCTNDTK